MGGMQLIAGGIQFVVDRAGSDRGVCYKGVPDSYKGVPDSYKGVLDSYKGVPDSYIGV